MPSTAIIALSAMTIGIAISAAVSTLRAQQSGPARGGTRACLLVFYALLAMLAAAPLAPACSLTLYHFYMPAILPVLLLLPPVLLRFVIVRTTQNRPSPLRWRDLVLPVLGALVMGGYWIQPHATKVLMLEKGELPSGLAPAALALGTFGLLFVWVIASFGYLTAAIRRLRSFRLRLKDFHSNTQEHELRWIDWFIALLIITWVTGALSLIGENIPLGLAMSGEIVISLIAAMLLFLMAYAPVETASGSRIEQNEDGPALREEPPKYARTALSKAHAERLAKRIEAAMRNDALYLNPNLSLQRLARHIGAMPNHVSQVLNDEIGSTFFDYVARWRVEAAKPLIASGKVTVLAAALEVGFNSRSTFYTAFKRETGLTPVAFRNSQ